jgi:uncharacterized protein (TIGR03435 family)
MKILLALLPVLHIVVPPVNAQTQPELRFTVASLKPLVPVAPPAMMSAPSGEEIISERNVRTPAGASAGLGIVSPGRVHCAGAVKEFVANAYDVREFQVEGPAWMDTARFVLDATMPPETTPKQVRAMWQNLLSDRFKLSSHRETKELPIYMRWWSPGTDQS